MCLPWMLICLLILIMIRNPYLQSEAKEKEDCFPLLLRVGFGPVEKEGVADLILKRMRAKVKINPLLHSLLPQLSRSP